MTLLIEKYLLKALPRLIQATVWAKVWWIKIARVDGHYVPNLVLHTPVRELIV